MQSVNQQGEITYELISNEDSQGQAKPVELESEFNINRMHYLSIL